MFCYCPHRLSLSGYPHPSEYSVSCLGILTEQYSGQDWSVGCALWGIQLVDRAAFYGRHFLACGLKGGHIDGQLATPHDC